MNLVSTTSKTKSKLPVISGAVLLAVVILFGRWLAGRIMPMPEVFQPLTTEERIVEEQNADMEKNFSREVRRQQQEGTLSLEEMGVGVFDMSALSQEQKEEAVETTLDQLIRGGPENMTPEQQELYKQAEDLDRYYGRMMEEMMKNMPQSEAPQP